MYIRRTHTNNSATGERYFTYRLVKSERVGGSTRQSTLLNLGRHFAIEQDFWPTLCARVDEIMGCQLTLLPIDCPLAVEREAQRIAALLLARRGVTVTSPEPASKTASPAADAPSVTNASGAPTAPVSDIQSVDVASLELHRPRSVGVEQLGLWAMQQLGFLELLTGLGINGARCTTIIGSIIARMAAPGSELAAHRWLGQTSGLGELLDVDYETLPLMSLYRASDVLWKRHAALEHSLFAKTCDLFNLDTTVTLYDLTNTYFEGEVPNNRKAHRGRSKEKRSDCPLVTLGLVLDGSGFVRSSQTFAGNVAEAGTLATMLTGLNAPPGALVVMDAGIASEANIDWLKSHGYRYLVVSRERSRHFNPAQAIDIETASGDTVRGQKSFPKTDRKSACIAIHKPEARKKRPWPSVFAKVLRPRWAPSPTVCPVRAPKTPHQTLGAHRPTQGKVPRHRPALPYRTASRRVGKNSHGTDLDEVSDRRQPRYPSRRLLPTQ